MKRRSHYLSQLKFSSTETLNPVTLSHAFRVSELDFNNFKRFDLIYQGMVSTTKCISPVLLEISSPPLEVTGRVAWHYPRRYRVLECHFAPPRLANLTSGADVFELACQMLTTSWSIAQIH